MSKRYFPATMADPKHLIISYSDVVSLLVATHTYFFTQENRGFPFHSLLIVLQLIFPHTKSLSQTLDQIRFDTCQVRSMARNSLTHE
ncbi:hypothetical protein HanIR_Chr16g0830651 [Helianthus annuus]|nr:hypothetical protein HanIR_Chr16g0830651 [Helianthus annuus]